MTTETLVWDKKALDAVREETLVQFLGFDISEQEMFAINTRAAELHNQWKAEQRLNCEDRDNGNRE